MMPCDFPHTHARQALTDQVNRLEASNAEGLISAEKKLNDAIIVERQLQLQSAFGSLLDEHATQLGRAVQGQSSEGTLEAARSSLIEASSSRLSDAPAYFYTSRGVDACPVSAGAQSHDQNTAGTSIGYLQLADQLEQLRLHHQAASPLAGDWVAGPSVSKVSKTVSASAQTHIISGNISSGMMTSFAGASGSYLQPGLSFANGHSSHGHPVPGAVIQSLESLQLPMIIEAPSEAASMSTDGSRSGLRSALPSVDSIAGTLGAGRDDSMHASPVARGHSTHRNSGATLASSLLGSLQHPASLNMADASPPHLLANALLPQSQGQTDSLWDIMAPDGEHSWTDV